MSGETEAVGLIASDPEAQDAAGEAQEVTAPTPLSWSSRALRHPVRKMWAVPVVLMSLGLLGISMLKAHMHGPATSQQHEDEVVVQLDINREATPSLFCFSIMQPKGYEPILIKAQLEKRAGIFACNEFAVISPEKEPLGNMSWGQVWTWKNSAPPVTMGHYGQNGQKTDSFLNTATFLQAWKTLISSGRMWKHDFIVKVDPDAVFFPDRLREHVRPDNGTSVFYANCAKYGPKALLYGSLEVFSMQAMQAYNAGRATCESLPWQGWGEDYYMQHCMQTLGVRQAVDANQVGDHRCMPAGCDDYTKAAYHDFKNPEDWIKCYQTATGFYDTTTLPPTTTSPPPKPAKPAQRTAKTTETTEATEAFVVARASSQPPVSSGPDPVIERMGAALVGPETQPPVLQPEG